MASFGPSLSTRWQRQKTRPQSSLRGLHLSRNNTCVVLRDDQMTEQRYSFLSGLLSVASSSLLGEMVWGSHGRKWNIPSWLRSCKRIIILSKMFASIFFPFFPGRSCSRCPYYYFCHMLLKIYIYKYKKNQQEEEIVVEKEEGEACLYTFVSMGATPMGNLGSLEFRQGKPAATERRYPAEWILLIVVIKGCNCVWFTRVCASLFGVRGCVRALLE